ncbi:MAG: hypothetical protein EOO90_06400 [Pedobacter sp.]|nr:MAG: hypothetical protein EOO90_06400 [Pedobacter sp.]
MVNQRPGSEDFQAYQRVNNDLDRKKAKNDVGRFSLFPKPTWLWVIVIAIVAFLCYYGLTVMLFGEEFWARSVTGAYK